MGVFTTRTLLNSVGVAQSRATSGAVAINWILKVTLSCYDLLKIKKNTHWSQSLDVLKE
jgi:hypothetical protein